MPRGSGVTVHGWVRGQRFADSKLGCIDLVGEVTELCPLPRAMDMGWGSASWTQQSPPQSRLLGVRGWGLRSQVPRQAGDQLSYHK